MRIWLSEFTHRRLERHMQMSFTPVLRDDRGFVLVSLPEETIVKATKKWGPNADAAINFAISHNERSARLRAGHPFGHGGDAA